MIIHRPEAIPALDVLSDPALCLFDLLLLLRTELAGLDLDDTEEALEPIPAPEAVHLLLHKVDDALVFDCVT